MITYTVIFAPIRQASHSDQVVQRLSNAIITGLLEPKKQSPNETDLAKTMGASHITIREALNTLRANNLIHTARGRDGGSFVCGNIDGKNGALCPFKVISTDYLSNLDEAHCAVISHSVRLASRRVTDADIAKFRELVEMLRRADSPELMTQADMRCLLAITASSHSVRLTNQELQAQAKWASPVTTLYRIDSIHAEVTAFYSASVDILVAHNETESAQPVTRIIDTFTYYLIEKKLKYNSN